MLRNAQLTSAPMLRQPTNEGKVVAMPVWFFVVLLLVVLFAVILAFGMNRRSTGGQNTTIIEKKDS